MALMRLHVMVYGQAVPITALKTAHAPPAVARHASQHPCTVEAVSVLRLFYLLDREFEGRSHS